MHTILNYCIKIYDSVSYRTDLNMKGAYPEVLPWLLDGEGRGKGDLALGQVQTRQQAGGVHRSILLLNSTGHSPLYTRIKNLQCYSKTLYVLVSPFVLNKFFTDLKKVVMILVQ